MKRFIVVLLFLAFLVGCEPVDSLNPLYNDSDPTFDEGLVGVWQAPEDDGAIIFTRTGYSHDGHSFEGYSIVMKDKDGTTAQYEGHLVKIGGQPFLDVVPKQWDTHYASFPLHLTHSKEKGSDIVPRLLRLGTASYLEFTDNIPVADAQIIAKLRPAHWFFKVIRTDNKLRMEWMDDEKFEKAVEGGKIKVSNVLLRDEKHTNVVITAPIAELQKFIAEHQKDPALFSESLEVVRKP